MVLKMEYMIEQDHGFIMSHSVSNRVPAIYINSLSKVTHLQSLERMHV